MIDLKEFYTAIRDNHGEGKVYKPDEEAVDELNRCHNLLKDMEHSSDMRYPYNWNDKLINNYVYSVALLWEYPKRHSVIL